MSADNGYVIRFNPKGEYVLQMYFASDDFPDIDDPNSWKFSSIGNAFDAYEFLEKEEYPSEYGLIVEPPGLWAHLLSDATTVINTPSKKEDKMIETNKFVRKPFHVDGIQVTMENMVEVAEWCEGQILHNLIKVRVHRPLNERQTKAYVGDWILSAGKGFKVYTTKAFENSFKQVGIETVVHESPYNPLTGHKAEPQKQAQEHTEDVGRYEDEDEEL